MGQIRGGVTYGLCFAAPRKKETGSAILSK